MLGIFKIFRNVNSYRFLYLKDNISTYLEIFISQKEKKRDDHLLNLTFFLNLTWCGIPKIYLLIHFEMMIHVVYVAKHSLI